MSNSVKIPGYMNWLRNAKLGEQMIIPVPPGSKPERGGLSSSAKRIGLRVRNEQVVVVFPKHNTHTPEVVNAICVTLIENETHQLMKTGTKRK